MTYRMDDGTVVKTEKATAKWDGKDRADRWMIHETLYRSRKGRYWVERIHERTFDAQAHKATDYAEWIGNHTAAQWLLANGYALPEDLAPLEAEVSE